MEASHAHDDYFDDYYDDDDYYHDYTCLSIDHIDHKKIKTFCRNLKNVSPSQKQVQVNKTAYCSVIRGNAPQFMVKAIIQGEWARTLVDTGATVSFVDTAYVQDYVPDSVKKFDDCNLSIRLGNGTREPVTQYIIVDTTVDNKKSQLVLWILLKV